MQIAGLRLWRATAVAAVAAALPGAGWAQSAAGQGSASQGSAAGTTVLPTVNIVAPTPLLGVRLNPDVVPAQTNVLDESDLTRTGTPNALRALNEQVGGVTLDSAAGNPFQPTLFYHGFEASPLQGTPQGIAVYLNGVRFNSPFGDTVNWDLIPDLAIHRLNLEGANPVFGLNALGGALNVELKNGFTYNGGEADLSGGTFGTVQGEFQYGTHSGNQAVYVAGNVQHQDGWRDLQSSDIYNFYSDLGWEGDTASVHVNLIAANSVLNGPGTSPVELLAADPSAQFTAPNRVNNKYLQFGVNGTYDISDNTSLQALAYYDYFQQIVVNGNAPNDFPCDDGSGLLCQDVGVPSTTRGGLPIPDFLNGGPYSELDDQTTNTNGYGASLQASNTDDIFGRKNTFVAGLSFDGAQTEFDGTSYIGGLTPISRVFTTPSEVIDEPGNNVPVRVAIENADYGVFATDTLQVTRRLAATLSGRFNDAQIDLGDQGGGDLSGNHSYNHFNPGVGLTYQATPWLTGYANWSEANRAPTPAELSCAGPLDSCSLANFFVGDPDLKQVVAHNVEAGIRGGFNPSPTLRVSYNLGYFHSNLDDDIVFINSQTTGRAFFANIGQTRRQGVDAGVELDTARWQAYARYSYTDATYQSGYTESAGSNPAADANGNITVVPGDRLPGIPAHQVKLGLQYKLTPAWTVGTTAVAASGAYLFGDEANLTPKLPGYYVQNLSTSYQITPRIQVFGIVENVFDAKYYTYGTFTPTSSVFLAQAPNATNPRSYSPAAPIGGYVGVRATF